MLNKKNIFTYYIFFIIIIFLSSILTAKYFVNNYPNITDENNNLILSNITYGWGDLINNLFNYQKYFTENSFIFYDENFNKKIINIEKGSYVQKLPFLPLFTLAILHITTNFYYFLIIKNLIIYSFFYLIVYISLKNLNKKIIFFVVITIFTIINPYIFFHTSGLYMPEQYGILFIPCIYILYLSSLNYKYEIISIFIFILCLSKGTFFLFCILNIFFFFIFEKKKYFKYKKYYPFVSLLMATLIWGSWSYIKTDRFAIGPSSESLNSIMTATAFNPNFHKYYPNLSVDLVPLNYSVPSKFKNEWEVYDFFKQKNIEYLKNNKLRYFKDAVFKINFIFFNLNKDGHNIRDFNIKGDFKLYLLFNKLVINFTILLNIFFLYKTFKKKEFIKHLYFFLAFLSLMCPLILIWATQKHLLPIVTLCLFYLIFNIKSKHLNS
jgi:4-amino-4-deoxy-L-arabinose transferase-like glycosyltransferase